MAILSAFLLSAVKKAKNMISEILLRYRSQTVIKTITYPLRVPAMRCDLWNPYLFQIIILTFGARNCVLVFSQQKKIDK